MENNDLKFILQQLDNLKADVVEKKARLFFFVADTGGKPMASIEYIYKMAKVLSEDGHVVYMLHEKDKYVGVSDWMGKEYATLNHLSLSQMSDNKKWQIKASDYFFIPELYGEFIKKLHETKLPSETVVICQSHSFIFKQLKAGENWKFLGVDNVITTSSKMVKFLEEYQSVKNFYVVNPIVSNHFALSDKPQKPSISIMARNPDDIDRLVKLFYQKYPMYAWIPFLTLGSMTKKDFADNLKETFLSVWIDEYATFGTFPLEAMACGVPVIVKIPDLIPEWAEKEEDGHLLLADNAIYLSNILAMPDYIAKFVESWLLDDVPESLYENMKSVPGRYSEENFKEQTLNTFKLIFEEKIAKIEATKQKYQHESNYNTSTNS